MSSLGKKKACISHPAAHSESQQSIRVQFPMMQWSVDSEQIIYDKDEKALENYYEILSQDLDYLGKE